MLSVLLALVGVLVQTTAGSAGAALTGASAGVGLDVGGAGGGAGDGAEAEEGMSVSVVDLLGAGFMGGTFTDDIMTTGAGGSAAGVVLTTAEEVDLTGSIEQ